MKIDIHHQVYGELWSRQCERRIFLQRFTLSAGEKEMATKMIMELLIDALNADKRDILSVIFARKEMKIIRRSNEMGMLIELIDTSPKESPRWRSFWEEFPSIKKESLDNDKEMCSKYGRFGHVKENVMLKLRVR